MYAIYLYFQESALWLSNSIIILEIIGKTVLLLQPKIILSIKDKASSNLSSGMNSSSDNDKLFGVSQSSSISSSISIAYL